ncbi:heterokaryon incompatibility protein-domain-containing protein, partial [Cercophora samala]
MYQKLEGEEFRVVHLLPGEFDDEIKCVLEIRPPNIKTAYEALSYQWGHDSELKTIRIIHLRRPPSSPDNQLAEARLRSALSMVTKRFYIIFAWCYFRSLQMPIATAILYLWWPWRLAYKFQTADIDKDSDFVNLQVTPSLDLALRYLRYKTACRTLWIDALCINQKDEGEKQIQIRHMQAIYANAWKVVVWLGGYHGITAGDTTCTETGDCFHRRQIKKFFTVCSVWHTLYHFLPGRRFLRYLCNFRVSDHCLEEAVDGLIDISKRGWWERLWVVQEVALATGPVHVQCGDSIYEYKRFCRTMLHMTQQFSDMTALQKASAAATTFIEVTSSFGWYPDDPFSMDPLMSWLVELLYRDAAKNRIRQFRDQKPAARLQTILLRTSGHFKCRDMQDRLCLTELVRMFGHYELRLGLFSDHPFRLCLASIIWEQFYVLVARYWPMFRPQFVIMDAKEVHQAIIGSSRDGNSQLQFFIGLAQYLATQTRRLSILDGAGCTADQNSQVPSWTPVWTRTIDKNARDFAISRDYVPPDKFHFSKDATTLTLQGRARGTITVARVINTTQPDQTQPLQRAFETWLFLPITKKMRMLAHLSFLLLSFGKIPATRRTATMKIL